MPKLMAKPAMKRRRKEKGRGNREQVKRKKEEGKREQVKRKKEEGTGKKEKGTVKS
ncbi:MAG: hypothetical protein LBK66_14100 [Spirochaetaceae bacterium]|nr:hypothetical protein [Spirochaetaceae bacterium]